MLPAALQALVDFHAPLSTLQREQGGAATLLTPGVNVLALNATFLPDDRSGVDLDAVHDWHEGQGLPVLVASSSPVSEAREVARISVGTFQPGTPSPAVTVEQVSRLHLAQWADVLTAAHGTPAWSDALSRHLAPRLEGDRDSVLLMAFRADKPVGALMWRAGAAHLWGALDGHAAAALLSAAFGLSGSLRVSVPAGSEIRLREPQPVIYSLLS